jgi:hypothetical protein
MPKVRILTTSSTWEFDEDRKVYTRTPRPETVESRASWSYTTDETKYVSTYPALRDITPGGFFFVHGDIALRSGIVEGVEVLDES